MGQRQSAAVGVQQSEQVGPPVQRADPPEMVVEEVDSSFGPESQPAVGAVATAERAASTGGHDAVIASTADDAAPHDGVSEEEAALWQALIHSPEALADSAGISPERLHELFVRAAAEVAAAEADKSAPQAGNRYRAGALREAAAAGHLDQVMSHLQAGSDPNAISEQLAEWGPLHYAAQRGHTAVVSALLEAGADPLARDTSTGETALTQAQYWGHTEVAAILAAKGGGPDADAADVVPVVLSRAQDKALGSGWFTCLGIPVWRTRRILPSNLTQLICSAPEFTVDPTDEHHAVMVRLFALCDKSHGVKFGYDWGGSATAEPADADPNRRVRTCCYSLACSCEVKGHWITGPVDWRNPKSVRGSMWFPKYKTKVMTSIQAEAQAQGGDAGGDGGGMIEIVVIKGGPVSQLELRTLPGVVTSAVADLKKKGVDIALAGDFGAEEITYAACFPLCCFQNPAKKLFSLHKRKKKTTTVFLRTYEAAEYFEMRKEQDRFARRVEVQGWMYLIGLIASLVWLMSTDSSADDASDSCPWKNDGECDEGWGKTPRCPPGTDMEDCCSDPGPLAWALLTAGGAQCNTSTTCVFD